MKVKLVLILFKYLPVLNIVLRVIRKDIFESFLDHPPLILPNETPRLDLTQPIPSPELQKEVTRLRTFLWGLDQDELPANQRTRL